MSRSTGLQMCIRDRKKGQAVVDMNNKSIEYGIGELPEVSIPDAWLTAQDAPEEDSSP